MKNIKISERLFFDIVKCMVIFAPYDENLTDKETRTFYINTLELVFAKGRAIKARQEYGEMLAAESENDITSHYLKYLEHKAAARKQPPF